GSERRERGALRGGGYCAATYAYTQLQRETGTIMKSVGRSGHHAILERIVNLRNHRAKSTTNREPSTRSTTYSLDFQCPAVTHADSYYCHHQSARIARTCVRPNRSHRFAVPFQCLARGQGQAGERAQY